MGPSTLTLETPAAPETAACVGKEAAQGAAWALLFSGLTKVMTFGSQIALAWFLMPEDFGLVAITLSLMQFTAVVGSGSFRNLLVQRADRFHEEAGQFFWLTLTLNLGAACLLVCASPVVAVALKDPRVAALILVAALAPPIQSLGTIYISALQRGLKFRQVAMIQCGASVVQNVCALLLAVNGAGAFSLVAPVVFTALWTSAAYRLSAGRIRLGSPNPRSWPELVAPVGWIMVHALFAALIASGASLIVGLVARDATIIGFYYWGYSVSSQAVFLLVNNLQGVLFPAFTRLGAEPHRQFIAVERAAKALVMIIAPVCVLQWLLAGPLIQEFFTSRWEPAISVVEWISVGLVTQPFYVIFVSIMLARGRFRMLALLTGLAACVTIGTATAAAAVGDQATIARAAAFALLGTNLAIGWVTYREFGHGWSRLLPLVTRTGLIAIISAAAGWWICHSLMSHAMVQCFATVVGVLAVYGFLVRVFLPEVAGDVAARLFGNRLQPGTSRSPVATPEGCRS